MRILHLYKDYYPVFGGIENHIRALAEAQVAHGHEVTVLVTHRGRATVEETLNGVRVIKAGRLATVASTPLSPNFAAVLRSLQPDITHVQSPYPPAEMAQWAVRRQRPYVVSYQAEVNRAAQRLIMLAYQPLFQRFLSEARRILAASPNFVRASPMLQRLTHKIALVPIGVDTTRFTPAPPGPLRPFTVLFMGQLRHYKGVEYLLRAAPHLPEARFLIAGQGPLRAAWEALSATLGVRDRVTFLGAIPDADLPALYQSADVFVLPSTSRAESFGIVLVEAMASGLPCVTTEINSGNSFVVQNEITGLVVPPRHPTALAAALRRLQADPALRAQFGAAGRARALHEFSVGLMVERVEQIYAEALAAP